MDWHSATKHWVSPALHTHFIQGEGYHCSPSRNTRPSAEQDAVEPTRIWSDECQKAEILSNTQEELNKGSVAKKQKQRKKRAKHLHEQTQQPGVTATDCNASSDKCSVQNYLAWIISKAPFSLMTYKNITSTTIQFQTPHQECWPPLPRHWGQHSPGSVEGVCSFPQLRGRQVMGSQDTLPWEQVQSEHREPFHWLPCCGGGSVGSAHMGNGMTWRTVLPYSFCGCVLSDILNMFSTPV